MTHALDRSVGYVLDALDKEGIADDTLVFFVNDNGGATNNSSENGPLRGRKGTVWEGGIRVPFLARWPNGLPKGKVYDQPVIALDLLPTCLAAAGAERRGELPLDGVDLLPHLRGQRDSAPHEALFWRHGDTKWAVRWGAWKLVSNGAGKPELFCLTEDLSEQRGLAEKEPALVAELQSRFDRWSKDLVAPLWSYGRKKASKR